MEYRSIECFADVTAVFGATTIDWSSCVADLVVCYYVDTAIDLEVGSVVETKWFVNYALSTECCIAMYLNIDDFVLAVNVLFWTCFAHWHRVLCLQMWWVMNKTHVEFIFSLFQLNTLCNMWSGIINNLVQFNRCVWFPTDFPEEIPCIVLQYIDK